MPKYPQVLKNVKLAHKIDVAAVPAIQEAVSHAERRLGKDGRVVLRASGTEPVIRVMVEGADGRLVQELAGSLAATVVAAAEAVA